MRGNQSKNVLHFISSIGFFGAEKVAINLSVGLNTNGIVSHVSALNNKHNPHLEILEEAKKNHLKTHIIESKGKIDFNAIGRLRKVIRDNNINLLHTHNYKSNMIGLIAGRCEKIPVVATAHGFTDVTSAVSFYERIDRWLLKTFFNKVMVVTSQILPELDKNKKRVIANGVSIEELKHDKQKGAKLRETYNIKDNETLVGTIGRLSYEKNQKLLIEAMSPIMKKNNNIKLMIVGNGPEMGNLKKLRTEHGLEDRLIFTGVISDIASVYSALDIFALTSLTEGIPLTILECMASNVPVITTNVGGIPDIVINNENGMMVPSNDASALSLAIDELIQDKDKCKRLISSAYDFVKVNYAIEHMCQAYRAVYDEVLN